MSGGYFNYDQRKIDAIAEEIDQLIRTNGEEEDECYKFNGETIETLRCAKRYMKVAAIYAQRIDWLVCGDDGEETFHKRLEEELLALTTRGEG